ncbi:hypothetical protein IWX65_001780 [Arthrobacter sp. CAN_A214]|uniref:hypothetical protein n=1 Tax=Arthrobacter sp. CAN_A214 TaxID=2787720 RepID=UPI0018CBE42A
MENSTTMEADSHTAEPEPGVGGKAGTYPVLSAAAAGRQSADAGHDLRLKRAAGN